MIAAAVHIIIHTARLSDGSRKVMQISEITGITDDFSITTKDIFLFKRTEVDKEGKVIGYFTPTGNTPSFINDIKVRGISMPDDIFKISSDQL